MDLSNLSNFLNLAQNSLFEFPPFPTLFGAHCILQSLCLRASISSNKGDPIDFSRQSPLSCFMLAFLYTFSGCLMSCLLACEPPLAVLTNSGQVGVMTAAWYLVFYCPYDLFTERVVGGPWCRTLLCILQDFHRLRTVISAVIKIHAEYPEAILYPVVFAVCQSSGFMFVKYLETLWFSGRIDSLGSIQYRIFVIPHYSTKTCILAALTITLQFTGYIDIDVRSQLLFYVSLAATFRLLQCRDPYRKLEVAGSRFVFGCCPHHAVHHHHKHRHLTNGEAKKRI